MAGKMQTEEKKKIIIRKLLDQGQYTKAIMYDDAEPNLQSFVELKTEYPHTKFYAWHVSLEGEASEYHRTNESINPDDIHKLADRKGIKWDDEPGFLKLTKRLTGKEHLDDLDQSGLLKVKQHLEKHVDETFADGKNPQDKGDAKRHGINTKASVSSLRKTAKQGGRKGQLAHWLANMKSGRAKK
jgi:hypothetical protein